MSFLSVGQPQIGEIPPTLAIILAATNMHAVIKRRRIRPLLLDKDKISGENLEVYFSSMAQLVTKTLFPQS